MALTIKNVTIGQGLPKICVPLTAATNDELVEQAGKANDCAAHVVEWRVDLFDEALRQERVLETLSHIRTALKDKILLFTFRTAREGGDKAIRLREYQELYEAAAASGLIDMIDIELEQAEYLGRGFVRKIKNQQVLVVMSSHNFEKTPADGEQVMKIGVMTQFGADIGKIAVMPRSINDVLHLMNLSQKMKGLHSVPLILISMGDLGKVTRVAGELTGSVMTFAALEDSSAPGQFPVEKMPEWLEAMHIGCEENG